MSSQQNGSVINWSEFHKPVVLEKGQWKKEKDSDESSYLLMKELKRAFSLISEFQEQHSQWLEQQAKDKQSVGEFNIPMNLAIVGERGSGKTSAVKSLKTILEEENYYVFDIVDPNTLSSEINILEILVSHIYKVICESEMEDLYQKEDAISLLKRIMTAIGIKRQKDAFLRKDNPSIDVLDKIKDLVELDNLIVDLFEKFRKLVSRIWNKKDEVKDLVLIIDDLDLVDHKYIHKLISEIQEFLNSKLIIVLAYRNSQLEEAVLSDKVEKSRSLLDKGIISIEELRGQVERMLYKILPISCRINLLEQTKLLKVEYRTIFDSLGIDEEKREKNNLTLNDIDSISVEDWLFDKIREMTGLYIKPVDDRESVNLFLPKSLREFIQTIEFISTNLEKNTLENYTLKVNQIKQFKRFFLNKLYNILPNDFIELIENWNYADSHQKNYLCFRYFFDKYVQNDIKLNNSKDYLERYPFDLHTVENYNLRLGDIYELMEIYKNNCAKSLMDYFQVYVMKVLYSLELIELITEGKEYVAGKLELKLDIKEKYQILHKLPFQVLDLIKGSKKYLDLINTNFMPANFNYLNFNTVRVDEDYEFIYDSKVHSKEFIAEYVACDLPSRGDVKKGIRHINNSFRYRKMYNYTANSLFYEELNLDEKRTYNIEYFTVFCKNEYYGNVIKSFFVNLNQLEGHSNVSKFLLFSMFQIDLFVRHNYTAKSLMYKYEYTRKRINDFIQKETKNYKKYFFEDDKGDYTYAEAYIVDMTDFKTLGTSENEDFLSISYTVENENESFGLLFEDFENAIQSLLVLEEMIEKIELKQETKEEIKKLKKSIDNTQLRRLTKNAKTFIKNIIRALENEPNVKVLREYVF